MTEMLQKQSAPMVLVIDDDEFAREVLGEMLSQLGVKEVLNATDGRVALRVLAAQERAPDFVICDVFMPDMDGIEFLDHLATQGFVGGIIMLSGVDANMLNLSKVIGSASGLRVLGTYTKPVSLEDLGRAMGLLQIS